MKKANCKPALLKLLTLLILALCFMSVRTDAATKTRKLTGRVKLAVASYDTSDVWQAIDLFERAGADVTFVGSTKVNPYNYDGLVVPGCYNDVNPKFYGQKIKGAEDVRTHRDVFRFKVIRKFILAGKPIYGICGGVQQINVLLGGTLRQHIGGHLGCSRQVRVAKKSLQYSILGSKSYVYHSHHQCPQKIGFGLVATEWDVKSKNIEALQHVKYPIYGVQYHPEFMGTKGVKIAQKFMKVCLKYRKKTIKVDKNDFKFIKY